MSNIAIHQPTQAQLNAMPLLASVQYYDPRPASSINRLLNGLFPDALYEEFSVLPSASGLAVTVQATDGLALVKTSLGEMIKVHGQHDIDKAVTVGTQYVYLIANFAHNAITKQVDTSSAINPADIVVSKDPLDIGLLLAKVTVPTGKTKVEPYMINFDNVKRFNFSLFARQADFLAHNHDGRYLPINGKAKSAITADTFANQPPSYYAKSAQVLTNVPANAVFTDTQRPLSSSVASTSETTAATLKGVKTAYDKGQQALNVANTKLGQNDKAVDSDKLDGKDHTYFARADQVLTDVPENAKFTDTQRPLSSSVTSTSTSTAATSNAAKIAYDKGVQALNVANSKLGSTATAVNADKLDGQHGSFYAKASQVLTDVPEGALFTDTNTWRPVNNSLTGTSTEAALSANQGRILKGLIDQLNALVTSDDTSLDELQDIVNFIKQNRDTLDSLDISNIAGLQNALNNKLGKTETATNSNKLQGRPLAQVGALAGVPYIGGDGVMEIANMLDFHSGVNDTDDFKVRLSFEDGHLAINGSKIWHAGNVGSGSGLNADKIDGYHLENLARIDANYITSGIYVGAGGGKIALTKNDGYGNANVAFNHLGGVPVQSGNAARIEVNTDSDTDPKFIFELGEGVEQGVAVNLSEALAFTLDEITYRGGKVWHAGNQGAGSGLNADMVDGKHADYFARADQVKTDVPLNAKFTDTQRPLSNSVASTSESTAATSKAVKTAYDKGAEALGVANGKLDSGATAVNADKLDGQHGSFYAKASQVLTNVPAGAVFTDTNTWRSVTDSVTSTSSTVGASAKAAKIAFDKGVEALNTANSKLGSGATAVNASKLGNKAPSEYVQTSGDQSIAGKKTFSSEIGLGSKAAIKFDAATDSIMFVFD